MFGARLDELDAGVRNELLRAALDGLAGGLPSSTGARYVMRHTAPAVKAGLLMIDPLGENIFRHPLVRAAVIHQADRLNLFTLAATTKRLSQEAANGRLNANDLSGGTFTLSNLGMYGLDSFTAVINPPEAGILALGALKEGPSVVEGAIVARPLMTASLSVDHRIIDGVTVAEFAGAFKNLLENPFRLTLEGPQELGV